MRSMTRLLFLVAPAMLLSLATCAAQLTLHWPLGRTCYQTNEWIDLSVVRADAADLKAATLTLTLTGADGSAVQTTFPAPGVVAVDGKATATEHLHLNGRLLRPGAYAVQVACDGATGTGQFELFSHLHRSSFTIADWAWNGASGRALQVMGEESMGYNVTYKQGNGDASIRGGLSFMRGMVLGGAHQLDGNLKNDWSDPLVLREGRLRASREALKDRTSPNCIGVHFYDEPGLTWSKHPVTGEFNPYNIAAQDQAWKAAYGDDPQQYYQVKNDQAAAARWREMNTWKQRFMEACWKHVSSGVQQIRPDWLTATQTQYGWDAFSDGYYFNIARQLPVINGHGWYSDVYWLNLAPPMASEFGRMRDWHRPCWYMPTWWQMNTAHARMEQCMSFIQNLQGMMWPGNPAWAPSRDAGMPGIVEVNKYMLRLGPIFTAMPVYRSQAAILYSLSQGIEAEIRSDMKDFREANGHIRSTLAFYAAGMRNQTPLFPVVEEDVLDGTLAAHHKVVILSKVEYLPPAVISALEDYIAGGGVVLLDNECTVQIKGAATLGLQMDNTFHKAIERRDRSLYISHNFMKNVESLAKDLRKKLAAYGVTPVFECDSLDILGRKQADGDIEYLFAVNMRTDPDILWQNTVRGTTAAISLPADGRPVYDALSSGAAPFVKKGNMLEAQFRFGPGQMRAFARTARPIGAVTVYPPRVMRDFVANPDAPFTVEVVAALVDDKGQVLAGAAPLQVRLIDPLGDVRYDLYRATDRGILRLALPLALNDPQGEWTIQVDDLLANTRGSARFTVAQPATAGIVAGATRRAVCFGDDAEKIYRFIRANRQVILIPGGSDFDRAQAERLAQTLKEWNVTCTITPAAEIKPATRGEWGDKIGVTWSKSYAVPAACILLGNPDDHPLIKFLATEAGGGLMVKPFTALPYQPVKDVFPGRGRGYLAWQLDGLGHDVESIACIAYDAEGMREAAGTLYEAAAGLQPLTRWVPPAGSKLTSAAKKRQTTPVPVAAWTAQMPDRALGMAAFPDGRVAVASYDGTLAMFDAAGKPLWEKTTDRSGEHMYFAASPDGRTLAISGGFSLVGFDGANGKQLFDVNVFPDKRMQFITALAVSADGNTVYAGTGDMCAVALARDGKRRWFAMEPAWGQYQQQLEAYNEAMRAWEAAKDDKTPKPAAPKAVKGDAYKRLAWSADGTALLAVTANGGHLFNTADGAFIASINGINGGYPVLATEDGFLATDGKNALQVISLAEKKVAKNLPMPGAQLVALAKLGDGWLLGTENDGSVRCVTALTGKLVEAVAWTNTVDTRIIKMVIPAGAATAVIYWGGSVQLLDAQGKATAEARFPQDITAAARAGDALVVALADGSVRAITVK